MKKIRGIFSTYIKVKKEKGDVVMSRKLEKSKRTVCLSNGRTVVRDEPLPKNDGGPFG